MALTKSLSFSLKRKRVLIDNNSCNLELFGADYESYSTPLKRFCSGDEQLFDEHISKETSTSSFLFEDSHREVQFSGEHSSSETSTSSSSLEDLPYEVLIKIVCCVDHDDLKRLILVSKRVMEATLEAKESHFAYSTPSKTKVFRNSIDLVNNPMEFEEIEAPNAPNQARRKRRSPIDRKILDNIAVALFSDDEEQEQRWPRRSLFM